MSEEGNCVFGLLVQFTKDEQGCYMVTFHIGTAAAFGKRWE